MEGECDCCCQTACACRTGIGVESFALPKGLPMPEACPYESYSYWPSYSYDFSFQLAAPAEAFCEESGFGQAECESHACCHFDAGACWWSGFSCEGCPLLPFFSWLSCEDMVQTYSVTCDDIVSWGYNESMCAGCPSCRFPSSAPTITPAPSTARPSSAPTVTQVPTAPTHGPTPRP